MMTKLHSKHRRNLKHMTTMRVEILKHSYLQTTNSKNQRMNMNEIMVSKLNRQR
jgi:hypothetical protein